MTQLIFVVATTCQNGTCSMLTSAKLSVGYLVVGITRELDKCYKTSVWTDFRVRISGQKWDSSIIISLQWEKGM